MAALSTHELTKDYAVGFWKKRPYRALDRLTLDVGQGEVFGFLGPNGAGKTTTLKLLMQLVFPTSGHGELLGRPLGDLSAKRRIGYLPENPYFYDYLSAEELLAYFGGLFGYSPADGRARASRLLDEVGKISCMSSFSVVVLPAPLGPRKPKTSPCPTCSVRSSRAA